MDESQVLEMVRRLKLFGMADTFVARLDEAKANKLSYEDFKRR